MAAVLGGSLGVSICPPFSGVSERVGLGQRVKVQVPKNASLKGHELNFLLSWAPLNFVYHR